MRIEVDTHARILRAGTLVTPCAIGRSGAVAAADKREGDGATPLGEWNLLAVLLGPGRIEPTGKILLPWRWISPTDGWSDDPSDPEYNRPVSLPHSHSAETLLRDDPLYDVVVVLDHNWARPMPGAGSAIFLHCWNDGLPTEGCVAIPFTAMARILPLLRPGSSISLT